MKTRSNKAIWAVIGMISTGAVAFGMANALQATTTIGRTGSKITNPWIAFCVGVIFVAALTVTGVLLGGLLSLPYFSNAKSGEGNAIRHINVVANWLMNIVIGGGLVFNLTKAETIAGYFTAGLSNGIVASVIIMIAVLFTGLGIILGYLWGEQHFQVENKD